MNLSSVYSSIPVLLDNQILKLVASGLQNRVMHLQESTMIPHLLQEHPQVNQDQECRKLDKYRSEDPVPSLKCADDDQWRIKFDREIVRLAFGRHLIGFDECGSSAFSEGE